MQIPAEYGEDYIVLAVSVGLATIGVCVFSAAYFGSRTFYFIIHFRRKNGKFIKQSKRFTLKRSRMVC